MYKRQLFNATLLTGANAEPPAERALLLQEFVEAEQINPDAAVQTALPHMHASLLLHCPLVFVQVVVAADGVEPTVVAADGAGDGVEETLVAADGVEEAVVVAADGVEPTVVAADKQTRNPLALLFPAFHLISSFTLTATFEGPVAP